eukprot:766180-Hanusia_phi.AAC.1
MPIDLQGAAALAGVVNSQGSWQMEGGILKVALLNSAEVTPDTAVTFSFTLVNGPSGQDAQDVYVYTAGCEQDLAAERMEPDLITVLSVSGAKAGDASPMKIYNPGFILKEIGQATPYPGANNTITATIALNFEVPDLTQSKLTIKGLLGSDSKASSFPLLSNENAFLVDYWNHSTGTARLNISKTLQRYTSYILELQLLNPINGQQHPNTVKIALNGLGISTGFENMNFSSPCSITYGSLDDCKPMQIQSPSFVIRNVGQVSAMPLSWNEIFVTLVSNYNLLGIDGTKITISGIKPIDLNDTERLLFSGGFDQKQFFNDVYESNDGSLYTPLTESASWPPREGHSMLALGPEYNYSMLIVGGRTATLGGRNEYLKDIWVSFDGIEWKEIVPNQSFPARCWFGLTRFSNKLIISGGISYEPNPRLNDVWQSTDGGINWYEVLPAADWDGRYGFAMLLYMKPTRRLSPTLISETARTPTLYVFAGSSCQTGCVLYDNALAGCETLSGAAPQYCCTLNATCAERPNQNDVWASSDFGLTWTEVANSSQWSKRVFPQLAETVDGSLMLISGYDSWDRYYSDMWVSSDNGVGWENLTINGSQTFLRRAQGQLVQFKTCMILVGGNSRQNAADFENYDDAWSPGVL